MIGVTGASGFIGAHLLAQLGDSGFVVDLRALKTPEELSEFLRMRGCQTIVHLAGPLPGVPNADFVATELAQRVAGAVKMLDKCHIVFSSSIRVHSRDEGVFSVNSKVAPFDAYGLGKANSEAVFLEGATETHPVSILRISSVQGIGVHGRAHGLVSVFARQAATGGPITVMGDGGSIKDLVDIGVVLNEIQDCIDKPPTPSQIVPVGSGRPTSVSELAKAVSQVSGVEVVHIQEDPNDLSGHVDCMPVEIDLQVMVEQAWRAVESEMGDA